METIYKVKEEGIDRLREHPRPEDVQKILQVAGMSGVVVGIVSHDCETEADTESQISLKESIVSVNAVVSSTDGTTTVKRRTTTVKCRTTTVKRRTTTVQRRTTTVQRRATR